MSNKISGVSEFRNIHKKIVRCVGQIWQMASGNKAKLQTQIFLKRKLGDELGHDRLPISPQVLTINKR